MYREMYEVIIEMKDSIREYPGRGLSFHAYTVGLNTYKARDILAVLQEAGYIYEERRKYYMIGVKP